jgi:2,4-dienoyl-CoA reductase-like NADH-dependent reductase (Old Yellow Enzyme family)
MVEKTDRFSKLFEPGEIGNLRLKNRIIMPAMGNRFCGVWGEVTDTLVDWYRRRAQGGVALVILEATLSATAIDPIRVTPRMLRPEADRTSRVCSPATRYAG